MIVSSIYWEMQIIDAASDRSGYKKKCLSLAQEFFQQHFPEYAALKNLSEQQDKDIQALLLSWFLKEQPSIKAINRAKAGLCLRCYVSHSILKACQTLIHKFAIGNNYLTCQDLLSYVLNDDGKSLVLVNGDEKTQLILNKAGQFKETAYNFFTVEVIQKFNLSFSSPTLSTWTYYQTRQNGKLKHFLLSEYGLYLLSDWAILNRTKPQDIKLNYQGDRILIETFHAVYRRDKRQQPGNRAKKCPDPTNDQLKEMLNLLQEQNIFISSPIDLLQKLKQVASFLREPVEPLELQVFDPETEEYVCRELPDPTQTNNLDQLEQRDLQEFLNQKLLEYLDWGIQEGINAHIKAVEKRPRYAIFALKIKPGLQLYCQGRSQSEIASLLGFKNQSQVSRVLEPQALLTKVRSQTLGKLLDSVLEKARELGLGEITTSLSYLENLINQLNAFADENIFHQALAEISTAKNRSMNSLYAQRLSYYLEKSAEGNYE